MNLVIESLEQLTPDFLTELFRGEKLLTETRVKSIKQHMSEAFNSTLAFLEIELDHKSVAFPNNLVLKLNGNGEGLEEVAFYQLIKRSKVDSSMLVPCLSAVSNEGTGYSHIILADMSKTHASPVEREALLSLQGVPNKTARHNVIEALARFHATWWQHPLLGKHKATQVAFSCATEFNFQEVWSEYQKNTTNFLDQNGDWLPQQLRSIYEETLEKYELLWGRYIAPRVETFSNLTLTHNDCYLTQFLCPKGSTGKTYLVDFQSACTDFATHDLVYLLATFWTTEQRQNYEGEMLEIYHKVLLSHGVRNYSFNTLIDDYRLMLIFMIFHPVWDWSYGASKAYWWPKMQCLTSAFEDNDCMKMFS